MMHPDSMSCDWQLSKENLVDRMKMVLRTSQWSDCVFRIGPEDDHQMFRVHKLILAASSPVFGAMCYGPLAEKSCISVPDIEPPVFEILLEYMYADILHIKSIEDACGVLYASKKYMMPHLAYLCREYILRNISPSNVLSLLDFSDSIQESAMYKSCVQVMCKYTQEIANSSNSSLSSLGVSALLDQNSLNISELGLFSMVLRWAEEECQQSGIPPSRANCRAMLLKIRALAKIRFLTMTPEEFADGPERSEILTAEEICAVRFAFCGLQNGNLQCSKASSSCGNNEEHSVMTDNSEHKCDEVDDLFVVFNAKYNQSLSSPSTIATNLMNVLGSHGLSCNARPRSTISVKQLSCARRFLKTSITIPGRLRLLTKLRVDHNIVMTGMRFFTRLLPQGKFSYERVLSHEYQEDLEVCVLDAQGELLSRTEFTDTVVYNTLASIMLSEPVHLGSNKAYSIVTLLPSGDGLDHEYPLSFMSEKETCDGVEFSFCDHAETNGNGTFVRRLDMGFVDTILFKFS